MHFDLKSAPKAAVARQVRDQYQARANVTANAHPQYVGRIRVEVFLLKRPDVPPATFTVLEQAPANPTEPFLLPGELNVAGYSAKARAKLGLTDQDMIKHLIDIAQQDPNAARVPIDDFKLYQMQRDARQAGTPFVISIGLDHMHSPPLDGQPDNHNSNGFLPSEGTRFNKFMAFDDKPMPGRYARATALIEAVQQK